MARRAQELDDSGGDSSFLTDDNLVDVDFEADDDDDDDDDDADAAMPSMTFMAGMAALDGLATGIIEQESDEEEQVVEEESKTKFLWDGEYDEGAYFDS